MELIEVVRHFLLWLKYRRAAIVNSREELEAALATVPPRIVVEGDETLRAYAATLAYRGALSEVRRAATRERKPPPETTDYLRVPTVGRITDGLRPPKRRGAARRPSRGVDTVFVACGGIVAALLVEILSMPDMEPALVQGHHLPAPPQHAAWLTDIAIVLLGLAALASLLWLVWQVMGFGRPIAVAWRLEERIQGRLVLVRVRFRAAGL